jgi:hypothetical protein
VWYSLHATKEASAAATKPPSDRVNNVEMIVVSTPVVNSTYTLTVTAKSLQGSQPYSLVATAALAPIRFDAQDSARKRAPSDAGLSVRARAVIAGLISVAALLLFYALWFMGFMSFLNFDRWCMCLVGTKKKKKNVARAASMASHPGAGCCGGCFGSFTSNEESVAGPGVSPSSGRLWVAVVGVAEQMLERSADVGLFRFGSSALQAKANSDSFSDALSDTDKGGDDDVVGCSAGLEQAEAGGMDGSGQDWRELSATSTQPPLSPSRPLPLPETLSSRQEQQTPPRPLRRATESSVTGAPAVALSAAQSPVASASPRVLLGDSLTWEPSPQLAAASHRARPAAAAASASPRRPVGGSGWVPSPGEAPSPAVVTAHREPAPSPIEPVQAKSSRRRRHSEGMASLPAPQQEHAPMEHARRRDRDRERDRDKDRRVRGDVERGDGVGRAVSDDSRRSGGTRRSASSDSPRKASRGAADSSRQRRRDRGGAMDCF